MITQLRFLNRNPLVVVPELATAVGLNEAIVLQQVHYWIQINMRDKRNYQDGHYWTYQSYPGWKEQFPFWSVETIKRTITRLEKSGFLVSGNFNKRCWDKTKWYRIDYLKLESFCQEKLVSEEVSGIGRVNMPLSMGSKCPDAQTVDLRDMSPEEMNNIKDIQDGENMMRLGEEEYEEMVPIWKRMNH